MAIPSATSHPQGSANPVKVSSACSRMCRSNALRDPTPIVKLWRSRRASQWQAELFRRDRKQIGDARKRAVQNPTFAACYACRRMWRNSESGQLVACGNQSTRCADCARLRELRSLQINRAQALRSRRRRGGDVTAVICHRAVNDAANRHGSK